MSDSKRLSIKRSTYRGQDGWLIYGSGYGVFGTSIFTTSRSSAEHIREQVRAGIDTTVSDFEPQAFYVHLDKPRDVMTLPEAEREEHWNDGEFWDGYKWESYPVPPPRWSEDGTRRI